MATHAGAATVSSRDPLQLSGRVQPAQAEAVGPDVNDQGGTLALSGGYA